GIHYCLNKTSYKAEPPMDFITLGGQMAGKVEVGYGPARLIDSNTVKAIHERLAKLTVEDLRNNYDPRAMEKLNIYPKIWLRDSEEGFDYIAEYFNILKSFIAHCSQHQLGMVVYLC
ncbi:YfbM family protein, partial [Methylocucumis oryzae]